MLVILSINVKKNLIKKILGKNFKIEEDRTNIEEQLRLIDRKENETLIDVALFKEFKAMNDMIGIQKDSLYKEYNDFKKNHKQGNVKALIVISIITVTTTYVLHLVNLYSMIYLEGAAHTMEEMLSKKNDIHVDEFFEEILKKDNVHLEVVKSDDERFNENLKAIELLAMQQTEIEMQKEIDELRGPVLEEISNDDSDEKKESSSSDEVIGQLTLEDKNMLEELLSCGLMTENDVLIYVKDNMLHLSILNKMITNMMCDRMNPDEMILPLSIKMQQ
jgi:hypothetical protein